MGVVTTRTMDLDSLVRFSRQRQILRTAPLRLTVPDGMTAPLGCDAVAVPEACGRAMVARLPRMGCVYADDNRWWWIVPSDSDVALEWAGPGQLHDRRTGAGRAARARSHPPARRQRPVHPADPALSRAVPGHRHDARLVPLDRRGRGRRRLNRTLHPDQPATAPARGTITRKASVARSMTTSAG